ncbi:MULTISPECIES: DNA topoisomerase IV subunit A [Archaeoglobus]|jgi:DNA topoisomerase-6 subunit A|uniref:Type 2 DNA topoisomerase 6 subunit A n=3 Tax=Archaeoglobus fulgidus TaxID=2234 RepID=TOP6A_ARCFU|nr:MULTISPECIES: DNA topoisomerase IV subunit A [Archaeoglobus]O29322.1 RecName: Full=Type 2 DNA topoisomerase 6 subunit A; AltName: Full=Type II DNA topoisomerase VI subunit A [Archaeoglobus fulgidus DSM 4304]AAB90299.1 DNA topoisomerase VI, subunit A (top6A) [Archaeoglobus fulgidus DSM 4304]AIG97813.1 DNA topoisomerase VI, subunit A [Archaeoglobus fulgidus DSM 8774]KUJ92641.1 MAG: Type 2 DNA topoisomerase 6 subunit A [Archaeoglobus fulgidus]KUK05860.1 MAG: Type 2 DNA topoisomerase 6 subunit 
MKEIERRCLRALIGIVQNIYDQMKAGQVPELHIATRTKYNIEFNEESEVWVYGDRKSVRSAKTVKGAYRILKMTYVIGFLKEQLNLNKSSTLRELYYISEGWGAAKFEEQPESDRLVEDLEILTNFQREHFHIRPEEDGATVIGPLRVREETRRGVREIHCQDDVGEGGYQIPVNVDKIEFVDHDAKFVIAIETGGMRDRLVENGFDEKYDAIIVHLKGQPARSTRRLLRRLNTELNLPVVVFTDGDPWSYRIFASVAYGSIKSAHLSEYLATPAAQFVGIRPTDIVKYDLPADKLTEEDIKALNAILTDPRFDSEFWKKEVNLQLEINKKSEQQALAKYGLDYVTDVYLPERLSELGVI